MSKIFVSFAQGYCTTASIPLALKLNRAMLLHSLVTICYFMLKSILSESKNISYLPCLIWQTQEQNIPN